MWKLIQLLFLVAYVGASPIFGDLLSALTGDRKSSGHRSGRKHHRPSPKRYYYKQRTYPSHTKTYSSFSAPIKTVTTFSSPSVSSVVSTKSAAVSSQSFIEDQVTKALRTPLKLDSRLGAAKSPSTAAALAYLKEAGTEDDFCGNGAQVFLEAIAGGASREEANAEATRAYIEAFNRGEAVSEAGSACDKAELAYREAVKNDKDPILEASWAYINNYPGVLEGNPCAVSGVEYFKAKLRGRSDLEATRLSVGSFAAAVKALAKDGASLKDKACLEASKAFWNAIPDADKPDSVRGDAFIAFADKVFNENADGYDPVCLAAMEGFLDSYASGEDLLTANLKAARAFLRKYNNAGWQVAADSACAAATLAYAEGLQSSPSAPNSAAMLAYIAETIKGGVRRPDPVCAAAAEAYFDAYIERKSEGEANEAAAVAYVEALDKDPKSPRSPACAKAAEAYIAEFDVDAERSGRGRELGADTGRELETIWFREV